MKLNYRIPPTQAGGGAVPGVGTIHIDEIENTLEALSDDLELPFSLNDYVIGSTGKREYSGDIDIVLDTKWYNGTTARLMSDLVELFGMKSVRKIVSMIHLSYPIVGYDPTKCDIGPRTGYVQVDFYLGDYKWENFYHYSSSSSAYKGTHRNLAISAVAATKDNNVIDSRKDQFDRPLKEVRYKWGQNGLFCVERVIVESKTSPGNYNKAPDDLNLGGPWKDPVDIAQKLFSRGTPEDLDSLESVISAIKRDNDIEEQTIIFKRIAKNFMAWSDYKMFYYPTEISPFIDSN